MATIGLVPHAGLGMAASRLSQAGRPARVTEALYCPPAVRDDPALAAAVQQRVDQWACGVGLAPGPAAGLGRLVVLAHPDTHDVGRLAIAARLLALGRVLAGGALGAGEADLFAPRAEAGAEATAAVLAQALDAAIAEIYDGCEVPDAALPPRPDPARAGTGSASDPGDSADMAGPALLSAMAGLSALPASPYQVQRVRREIEALVSAAPGGAGTRPPWEHLSLGHINAYSPALAALDAVDGFELSPSSAADPELRRAQRLAALAAALLHDIAAPSPSGLTAAIARADGLGPGVAGRRAAEVHDEAMRAFQYHAAQLASSADPATRRYLSGLWTWLGGHRSWHAVS
jgi:2-methylisoborneol synthase